MQLRTFAHWWDLYHYPCLQHFFTLFQINHVSNIYLNCFIAFSFGISFFLIGHCILCCPSISLGMQWLSYTPFFFFLFTSFLVWVCVYTLWELRRPSQVSSCMEVPTRLWQTLVALSDYAILISNLHCLIAATSFSWEESQTWGLFGIRTYKNMLLYICPSILILRTLHSLASQALQHIHIPPTNWTHLHSFAFESLCSFHSPLMSTTFPLSTWTWMLFFPVPVFTPCIFSCPSICYDIFS